MVENAPKTLQICNIFLWVEGGGTPPDPRNWITFSAPILSAGRSLTQLYPRDLDSLHAKNEFYYKGNESILLIFP